MLRPGGYDPKMIAPLEEVSTFGTCSEDKSHAVDSSSEISRDEAGPASVVSTYLVPQAEQGCQARRAPAVISLEYLVENRGDQEMQDPGQVRQVLSSTVMVGQEEEEIVKEDISVIHPRESMDPRVTREPEFLSLDEIQASEEQMTSSDVPGSLAGVTEEGEPLRRFILNQLGTMSPPATFIRISQSINQCPLNTGSSSVDLLTGSGKSSITNTNTIKPRVVPELNFFTDQEIYRGRPVSEKLFDEFLEDEANGNLIMRKMVPLRRKSKRTETSDDY